VEGEGFSKCVGDSLEGVHGKTPYKSEFEPERDDVELNGVPLVSAT